MKIKIITILLLTTIKSFTQSKSKTYLRHDHNYSMTYSYDVSELTINSDSTFTWKTWDVRNKKEWKKYKNHYPILIDVGKVYKKGDFHILREYINGEASDITWTVKITDRKLKIYSSFDKKKGKRETVVKYKRIKNKTIN